MMNNWIDSNLKEICDISIGRTPPRKEHKWFSKTKGIPWISIADMGKTGKYISKTKEYLSEEAVKKFKIPIIKKDTIILSFKMTVGRVSITESEMLSNEAIAHLNNCKIETEFLYYYLRQFNFSSLSSTSSIVKSAVNSKILKEIPVLFPKKRETQRKIANFISQFDEKIELNQKMNETLKEIAKTLFKSWFIDFDPVRAKAEGRPTGFSKEISNLFPDSFEDSELGEIPKGWQITNLDAITSKFTTGLNPRQNFVLGSGDNFYVTIKNLGDFEVELDKKCDKVDNDAIKKINSRSDLKKDDILFSGIGTIGKAVYVFDEPKNWNISESVFSLRANPELTFPSFLYQLLKSYPLQGYVDALASGSVQRGIRMGSLKEYKFSFSNYEIQKKFNEIISPLIRKISSNLKETRILISIRDTLLPKLISGELKIPDAENLAEEAGI